MAFTYAGQYTEAILATGSGGATLLPSLPAHLYTVGTSTHVTLYTSRTKGTTTTNPVTTDVNGNVTFFADPGQYDIVFTPTGGSLKRITITVPVDPAEGSATYYQKGQATNGALNSLPQLVKAVRSYNDSTLGTIRVVGMGSSVGLGPDGALDAVNAVSAKIDAAIDAALNPLGNATIAHTNASVGGSTITSGQQTDYALAKTAAGGTPTVLILTYGMNDGTAPQYHLNQTYPGVYTNGLALIQQAKADGADVIIVTSPHPHTVRETWAAGGTVTYPAAATQIPDATLGQSIKTVTSPSGVSVPASYRHLRVNQALRQLAADTRSVLIDAEPYWFDAVAAYGEDALFGVSQFVHPNLFGFQQSYHKAIADFATSLNKGTLLATGAPVASVSGFVAPNPSFSGSIGGNTAAGGGANTPDALAFYLTETVVLDHILIFVGVQSGNIDVGIYDANSAGPGTGPAVLLSHSGSVACPAAGGAAIAIPAVTLTAGKYYAALVADNGTATFRWRQDAQPRVALTSIRQLGAGFPLPATGASFGANGTGTYVEVQAGKG